MLLKIGKNSREKIPQALITPHMSEGVFLYKAVSPMNIKWTYKAWEYKI